MKHAGRQAADEARTKSVPTCGRLTVFVLKGVFLPLRSSVKNMSEFTQFRQASYGVYRPEHGTVPNTFILSLSHKHPKNVSGTHRCYLLHTHQANYKGKNKNIWNSTKRANQQFVFKMVDLKFLLMSNVLRMICY